MISIGGVIGTGLFLGTANALRHGGPIGLFLGTQNQLLRILLALTAV